MYPLMFDYYAAAYAAGVLIKGWKTHCQNGIKMWGAFKKDATMLLIIQSQNFNNNSQSIKNEAISVLTGLL